MSFLIRQSWRQAERWHAEGHWRDETVTDLVLAGVRAHPQRVAVVDRGREMTWRALGSAAARLCRMLAGEGVGFGDIVVLQLPDSALAIAARVALDAMGAVASPMTTHAGEAELAAVIQRTRARAYVGLQGSAPATPVAVAVDPMDSEWWGGEESLTVLEDSPRDADAMTDLMFTSGTTGRPKGVMNSANTKLAGLRGLLSCYDFGADDVWALVAPLSHNAGWLYTALPALATGAASVVVPRGDPAAMLDTITASGATATFLVPTHLTDLLAAHRAEPERWRPRLRYVLTGAAAADPEAVREAVERWGTAPISLYGMTECQANLFTRLGDRPEIIATTVGRPCPTSEVALRSPSDGRLLTHDGDVGEIVTRGPTTFLGYFDDQEATSETFTADGWMRSGDLAELVSGNFRIVGRIKEVILRGGVTVHPVDVEAAAAGIGLDEVAAVGLPDDRLGERICLCVVGDQSGPVPDVADLRDRLTAAGVGRHLWPDEVVVVGDFPRTDLGKVQRARLRAWIVDQRGHPQRPVAPLANS